MQRLFPKNGLRIRINAIQGIAQGTVQAALRQERFGTLVRPDAKHCADAEILHGLVDLGAPFVGGKTHPGIRLLVGCPTRGAHFPLSSVEPVRCSGGSSVRTRRCAGPRPARSHVFGLLHALSACGTPGNLVALTKVALLVPHRRRGCGVFRFVPDQPSIVLMETVERAIDGRQIKMAVGRDWSGNDLPCNRFLPILLARPDVEACQAVRLVMPAVGIGHVHPASVHGGHAHQRIPQPLFPDGPALDCQHLQLAAFRVEDDITILHDCGCWAIVRGLILPGQAAGGGVESIELVAAEPAAEKDSAIGDGRCGQWALPGNGDFPALDPAILTDVRSCRFNFGKSSSLSRVDFHEWTPSTLEMRSFRGGLFAMGQALLIVSKG